MAFLSNLTLQIQFWMLLCVILIFVPISYTSRIRINSDGGYTDIVVAVSDRVTGKGHSNWNLDKLTQTFEEFFWQASQHLYNFTRHRTFLRKIQVLVPHTWDKFSNKLGDATYESYLEADVRFDVFNPSPGLGDLYTRQRRRCGEKGDYIYMDSKFLLQWEEKQDPEFVERYVQEWTKLRYGIPKNTAQNNSLCGFRSGWDVIESSEDLKSVNKYNNVQPMSRCIYKLKTANLRNGIHKATTDSDSLLWRYGCDWAFTETSESINKVSQQMSIDKLKPTINYVKPAMDVVIVMGTTLFATDESKKILIHTLKKFIYNFPDNGRVGYYSNVGCCLQLIKQMSKREPIDRHLEFIDSFMNVQYKPSVSLLHEIEYGLWKLGLQSSRRRHLVVITNEPEIRHLPFYRFMISRVNFFLLTLTPYGCKISSDIPRKTRNFLDKPPQNLWVDVKNTSSVNNCNYTPAKYIDNALVQFFTKFGNEDFYPNKIKIHDYSLAFDEKGRFVLPFTGASITFNVYSCFQNNGRVSLTIYVDDSPVKEVSGSILDYSYSYVWKHSYAKGTAISFRTIISTSKFVEAVVWVDNIKGSNIETVLDMGIDTGTELKQNNLKKPFIVYAYNPNTYVLTVDMVSNRGKRLYFELMDDGNEGDDLSRGDYIYSQYIIDSSASEDRAFSIKINARDKVGNNVIQLDYGWVWLNADDLKEFSPRRINNFKLEHIDGNSSNAHFAWSAPSTYDNQGFVNAYYLVCNSDANNLSAQSVETAINKYKINLLPKKPGEMEYYTLKIPFLNTTPYCIMLSTNEKNLSSESSNVVAVVSKPTILESDIFPVLVIVGIIVGCCVLISSIGIFLCFCKRRRHTSKHKVQFKKTYVSSDATTKTTRQLITHNPITKQVGSSKNHIPLNVTSSNCTYSNSSIGEPTATCDDTSSPYSDEITRVQEDGHQIGNINYISPLDDGYIQLHAISYKHIVDRKSRKCRIM